VNIEMSYVVHLQAISQTEIKRNLKYKHLRYEINIQKIVC